MRGRLLRRLCFHIANLCKRSAATEMNRLQGGGESRRQCIVFNLFEYFSVYPYYSNRGDLGPLPAIYLILKQMAGRPLAAINDDKWSW
jgi:hypothetical protein